jgi:hypothetical protein
VGLRVPRGERERLPLRPEHAWLRRTLTEAAASLPPVASELAAVRPVLALALGLRG